MAKNPSLMHNILYSILSQKPSVTLQHNMLVTENSVIHGDRSEKSVIYIDWDATEFSIAHMLFSCVTLGFF
jgi:hypothetical protein